MIAECISLDILLLICLYLINWHYCFSGEETDLFCSEHLSPEEITMAYKFGKHQFPWPIRIPTLLEYQARWLMNETGTVSNCKYPTILTAVKRVRFCMGFELSCVLIRNTCFEWRRLSLYLFIYHINWKYDKITGRTVI